MVYKRTISGVDKGSCLILQIQKKAEYSNGGIRNVGNGWIFCNPTIHLFVSDSILPENDSKRKLFVIECATKLGTITIEVEDYAEDGSRQRVKKRCFGLPCMQKKL